MLNATFSNIMETSFSGGRSQSTTSLSPIQRGLAPSFVNYKKGALGWVAAASDKVYQ
jgi:hypothetical protein